MTQSSIPSPRPSSTLSPRLSASEAREELVVKITAMLAENPELAGGILDASLPTHAAETGSDKTDPGDIWTALRTTQIPGPSAGSILSCLRAVEDDIRRGLRKPEVDAEQIKRLAEDERGAFGEVLIAWQATLARNVFLTESLGESFSRGPGRIESYLRSVASRSPENQERLERFLREIKEAKSADHARRQEEAEARQAEEVARLAADPVLAALTSRTTQRPAAGARASKASPPPAVDYDEVQPPEGAHLAMSFADQAAASGGKRRAS